MTEKMIFMFSHCPVAAFVWELAPLSRAPTIQDRSMFLLMLACFDLVNLPPAGVYVPLWPWLLWNLWKARNKLCFEDRIFSGMEIVTKSIVDARNWQEAQMPPKDRRVTHKSAPKVANNPVPAGTVVCNVDAAWNASSGNCGLGVLYSGDKPTTLVSRTCEPHPFVSSAMMAEALATFGGYDRVLLKHQVPDNSVGFAHPDQNIERKRI